MSNQKREYGDPTCIFYRARPTELCTALKEIHCDNCPFYKDKATHTRTKKGYINKVK